MTGTPLGRLRSVAPREVWPHEAHDFTPWLLQNVDVLSDLLGMDLVLEAAEHPVGGFSLDLIGKDEATDGVVIVENQLEMSDHLHLGQIITYAAGTDPTTIVWVTTGFRPEHRAAIDWLNQRTDEDTRIFGVVIKVVQIGDSPAAPNFELVAQPNDWEKQVRRVTERGSGEISGRELQYRQFWELVLERIRVEHPTWTRARTTNQVFCNTSTGIGAVTMPMQFLGGALTVQIYFDGDAETNMSRFEALLARKEIFEAALGQPAQWDRMEEKKGARVFIASTEFKDVSQTELWPQMVNWLIEHLARLRVALDAAGGIALFAGAS